jgi:hypothetical protein
MVPMALVLGVAVAPVLVLVGLFWSLEVLQDARARATAAQVAVTEAIHHALGTVVAPTVRRRLRGWQLHVAVPFGRPQTVAAVLAIAHEVLSAPHLGRPRALEIVLTPQTEVSPRAAAAGAAGAWRGRRVA